MIWAEEQVLGWLLPCGLQQSAVSSEPAGAEAVLASEVGTSLEASSAFDWALDRLGLSSLLRENEKTLKSIVSHL